MQKPKNAAEITIKAQLIAILAVAALSPVSAVSPAPVAPNPALAQRTATKTLTGRSH